MREAKAAVAELERAAEAAQAQGDEGDAEEAAEVAGAAADAHSRLLMAVGSRLEGAVDDTCIPPCFAPDPPREAASAASAAAGGSVAAAAAAAAASASRRLARAIRLLRIVGRWADLLDPAALRELAATLLRGHILPHLEIRLRQGGGARSCRRVLDACERVASSLPPDWRRREEQGRALEAAGGDAVAQADCASLLRGFLDSQLGDALRGAAADAGTQERWARLVATFE